MKDKINKGITRLGEKFEFDANYFIKNSFWLFVGQGIMSLSALFATVFLANFVSEQNLGDYRLVIAIYTTLTFFALSGIGVALARSIANNNDGSMKEAIKIKSIFTILSVIIGLILAFYFGIYRENIYFGLSVLVATLCFPFVETFSLYAAYLQGKHEFKYSSINTGLIKLFSSLAIVFVSYFYPVTLAIVSAFYISQALITFIQYRFLLKKFPPQNDKKDEEMFPYAKHLTFAGFSSMLFGQADKFILYHFFGPIALAKFWIASTVPQEVGRMINTLSQVVFPKFVKAEHSYLTKKALIKKFLLLSFVFVCIAVTYSLIAYPFFNLFFPKYTEVVTQSIVLMFAFTFTPSLIVWSYFYAKKNIKVIYINSITDPILQVLLYMILIPTYGIWGLVFAILIKTVIMNVISLIILKNDNFINE